MATQLVRIGEVVSDGSRWLVGTVKAIRGDMVELCRPSGLTWSTSKYNVRPASPEERRSLESSRQLKLRAATLRKPPAS